MSELSFLIDLLLNHKLSKEVKTLVAERIKAIETQPQIVRQAPMAQAPSTLMNMNKDLMSAVVPPAPLATNRVIGGEVDTGKGTRGPRKF